MKKILFSLMLLGVSLSSLAQKGKYDPEFGIGIADEDLPSKVIAGKVDSIKKFLYCGDEWNLDVPYFYGGNKTPVDKKLKATKDSLYRATWQKGRVVYKSEIYCDGDGKLHFKKSDSIVTITRVQDSKVLCTIEPFNPKDTIHQRIAREKSNFSFECKADTVQVGDTVQVTLKFTGNNSWELNNGVIMLDSDTVCRNLNVKGSKPSVVRFAVPGSLGERKFSVYGDFKHDYFGFDGAIVKYDDTLTVEPKEDKGMLASFCSSVEDCWAWFVALPWYFNILPVVAVLLVIISVILWPVSKNKKNKKEKGDCGDDTDGGADDENGGADSTEQPSNGPAYESETVAVEGELEKLNNEIVKLKETIELKQGTIESKDKDIKKLNEKINQLESSLKKEKEKVEKIAKERDDYHSKKHQELESKIKTHEETIKNKDKKIGELNISLTSIKQKNNELNTQLGLAYANIDYLKKAQAKFSSRITFVPFAEQYCKNIQRLIEIAGNIGNAAADMRNIPSVDDPWHILKAIARFSSSMQQIDLMKFYTEVKMVCSGQIVLNDTMLCKYDQQQNPEELSNSLKTYFYDTYLCRYIDALVVFNETLAGLNGLTHGISQNDVAKFITFRSQLMEVFASLGITVNFVSLFEDIEQKLDLQVETGDFGDFSSGTILDIENCIVYLTGGKKPASKIRVKVQE